MMLARAEPPGDSGVTVTDVATKGSGMAHVLVCIPARRDDPEGLFGGSVDAVTANDALLSALDYTPDMGEEAEYAALVLASVWALARFGERFVVTAQVESSQVGAGSESGNGGVRVTGLRRDQLVAVFSDDEGAPVTAAAEAARGLGLDDAWERPEVSALLDHELLWHTIEEGGL